ncbi:MAG TPA: CpsD/CapB family tyrosine-protein kinase [Blastocatellia bacterium]|nr:CpsD/CapB family tyrosine-protein kinase [Blastocatellia bacterium]HMV84826.1 CpsD/CapB family tyrosine-protein kinase [Blastocatellia bacterium]HMX26264.1 CpsD/CapB family tyrosine-protein kinase [Blastocatellia bacterium]HMY70554.1 CpsD/CapB family tyrosine-protein kinase [Blastocatellia bacterium]HMZ21221.1 CpsD/CapB family tyrosine-protein kinase [Blastocatellia bacterium]
MGRIHDALTKKEDQGQEKIPPRIEVGQYGQNGKANGHATLPDSLPKMQFDFLNYSLAAAAEPHVANGFSHEFTLPAPPAPLREVALDAARLDPHLVTLLECDPAAAEQYQRTASSLIAAAAERPLKRVLIASALQGDGRTCVMLNLAGALAQARRRVLVMDTDFKHPSVSRLLGLETETGLTELLAEDASADQARCKVMPRGFDILPTHRRPDNAAELLASSEFAHLLDGLDHDYDFVLFDSSPLLTTDEGYLLLRMVDTALLVVAQGKCSSAQATRAVSRIAREDIFGVVLNRLAN